MSIQDFVKRIEKLEKAAAAKRQNDIDDARVRRNKKAANCALTVTRPTLAWFRRD
jgi:hypothetical protein